MKYLAEALVKLKHKVVVLTTASKYKNYIEGEVNVIRMPIYFKEGKLAGIKSWLDYMQKASIYLKRIVKSFDPDVINSFFLFPSGYIVAHSGIKRPHIISIVGADIFDPTRRWLTASGNFAIRNFSRKAVENASLLTVPSKDLSQRTKILFPKAVISTIPWGIPEIKYTKIFREELNLPKNAFVIISICRLVKRKRLDKLLEGVYEIKRRGKNRNICVVIIGDGPEFKKLEQKAKVFGIEKEVIFLGNVKEEKKYKYLSVADIFCLPSEHEGFGLVFLEAMNFAVPIIATNIGGQNDIVRDGIDGFLVPANDQRRLVDVIYKAYHDSQLLKSMSYAAKMRSKQFIARDTAVKFYKVYEQVLSK